LPYRALLLFYLKKYSVCNLSIIQEKGGKEKGQYKEKKAVQVQVTIYSQRKIKYCM